MATTPDTFIRNKAKIYNPIPKGGGIGGVFGEDRGDHIHAGLDIDAPTGSPCIAPVGGILHWSTDDFSGGGMIHFEFTDALKNNKGQVVIPKGARIGWGHCVRPIVSSSNPTRRVKANQKVAETNHSSPHVHFIYNKNGETSPDGNNNPQRIWDFLRSNGKIDPGNQINSNDAVGQGAPDTEDLFAIGRSAALSTVIELPGILNQKESLEFTGDKSIYNDEPLFDLVAQLTKASMRHFQSLPNGQFFAFFPDYFGHFGHRKAYWQIDDLEIIDGGIDLTDEPLATHVFVAGDTVVPAFNASGGTDFFDRLASQGVVTIYNAFRSDFIIQKGIPEDVDGPKGKQTNKEKERERNKFLASEAAAVAFLRKYGQRPYIEDAPWIRNNAFEFFYAVHTFMLMWSNQFLTTFQFTFMPELYPGGRVRLPNHHLELYIESVQHTFDYEGGFHTTANLMAPTSTDGDWNVSKGMIKQLRDVEAIEDLNEGKKGKGGKRD